MVSFEQTRNRETTEQFVDSIKLFSIASSHGSAESLITQPVTTTHHVLSPEERARPWNFRFFTKDILLFRG